jgi:ParB/RepB/Spo0J family partition protein
MPKPKRVSVFDKMAAAYGEQGEANGFVDQTGEPLLIALDQIDPNPQQARQVFDEGKLEELAASIAEHGVMQPIGVRFVGDRYVIIYGERRYRAASIAGLTDIPATVHDVDEQQAVVMTALENLQREDLDIEDEARYFQTLLDNIPGMTQRGLAKQLGINHVYISRRVKLLNNPKLMAKYQSGQTKLMQALEAITDETQETQSVSRRNTFHWRPVQRSYATLQRLKPEQVPDEERETFKRMLHDMQTEIKRLRDGLGD